MNTPKMQFTVEELEEIIELAFYKGEQWGTTYQGWFTPEHDDHEKHMKEAKQEIFDRFTES